MKSIMGKKKKIILCVALCFLLFILLFFSPIILLSLTSFSDKHSYYMMKDCSIEQSREMLKMIGLEYQSGTSVCFIEHKTTWGDDTPRKFYIQITGDAKLLSDYKDCIDNMEQTRREEDENILYFDLMENNVLSFYYTYNMRRDGKACELEQFIRKNGEKKYIIFDSEAPEQKLK